MMFFALTMTTILPRKNSVLFNQGCLRNEDVLYSVRQLSIRAKLNVEKTSVLGRMKQLQEHKVGTDVKSTKVRKEYER